MKRADVVIVGGGQAGLAVSYCLTQRGIDHVVLERARLGERWRSERWDSLRLITPNWMTRLPGWHYRGTEPDGFMPAADMAAYLAKYAHSFSAPVAAGVAVTGITRHGPHYRVMTDYGEWAARCVVIATGCFDKPFVPAMAHALSPRVMQVVPTSYRNPGALPEGGVLVVGASATGAQLAEEIHLSGRPVTLAVGQHIRLPRTYRGRDIMWWLDRSGILDERIEDVADVEAARRQPSLQLAGGRSIDLAGLQALGVRLVGRVSGIDASHIGFADDLAATTAAADAKLQRVLARCDRWAAAHRVPDLDAPETPTAIEPGQGLTQVDLARAGIRTVLWATGFRRRYDWLQVDTLDAAGEIIHQGGVTASAGLYAMGLRFMRRRKSTFIDGAGPDAEEIAAHIGIHLAGSTRRAA